MLLTPLIRRSRVNPRSRSLSSWAACATVCLTSSVLAVGCGSTQRHLIFEHTVPLPNGRFIGPIDVEVPRRADHALRDFEFEAELTAACSPALTLSFPDGERTLLGDNDGTWQGLLSARAAAGEVVIAAEPPLAESPIVDGSPAVAPTPPQSGRWIAQAQATWPGQLAFLDQRGQRCARTKTYSTSHYTAFDRSGLVTVWAEVPQELESAQLTVRVYEIVGTEMAVAPPPRERPVSTPITVTAHVELHTEPTSPVPPLKVEKPGKSVADGARWKAGSWAWSPGDGKWVWIGGTWAPPSLTPAARVHTGSAPIAGSEWVNGYWAWRGSDGAWVWQEGYWTAPPPKVETPPPPQVPEQSWVAGSWLTVGTTFKWQPGYYGAPTQRIETPPAAPTAGARWIAGRWMQLRGTWTWIAGFYERADRPPPAPKAETPPPSPGPDAVWLAGYWRWNDATRAHTWIAGHWELPPGVGYVWVPDPAAPQSGGSWQLRININVGGTVRVTP